MRPHVFLSVSIVHFALIGLFVLWPESSKSRVQKKIILAVAPTAKENPVLQELTSVTTSFTTNPHSQERVRFWQASKAAAPQKVIPKKSIPEPISEPIPEPVPEPIPDPVPDPVPAPPSKNIAAAPQKIIPPENKLQNKTQKKLEQQAKNQKPLPAEQKALPPAKQEAKLLPLPILQTEGYQAPKSIPIAQNTVAPLQDNAQDASNGSILDAMASPYKNPQNGLQNGELNWKLQWDDNHARRLVSLPKMDFPRQALQDLEEQSVEVTFQVDSYGRVVSTSFAGEQLKAYNWQINSYLLGKVRQFVFEKNQNQWLSRGKVTFHFVPQAQYTTMSSEPGDPVKLQVTQETEVRREKPEETKNIAEDPEAEAVASIPQPENSQETQEHGLEAQ